MENMLDELILGNSSINIFNGGSFCTDNSGFYFVDDNTIKKQYDLTITNVTDTNEPAQYLNIINESLYFLCENEVIKYDISNNRKTTIAKRENIKNLVIDQNENIYYLCNGEIYINNTKITNSSENIERFYPTIYGIVYSTDYKIYLYSETSYDLPRYTEYLYIENNYLIICNEPDTKQIDLSTVTNKGYKEEDLSIYEPEKTIITNTIETGISSDEYALSELWDEKTSEKEIIKETEKKNNHISSANELKLFAASGRENVVQNAYAYLNAKWTPLKNVSSKFNSGFTFVAGTTYTGVPYGQVDILDINIL